MYEHSQHELSQGCQHGRVACNSYSTSTIRLALTCTIKLVPFYTINGIGTEQAVPDTKDVCISEPELPPEQ